MEYKRLLSQSRSDSGGEAVEASTLLDNLFSLKNEEDLWRVKVGVLDVWEVELNAMGCLFLGVRMCMIATGSRFFMVWKAFTTLLC